MKQFFLIETEKKQLHSQYIRKPTGNTSNALQGVEKNQWNNISIRKDLSIS